MEDMRQLPVATITALNVYPVKSCAGIALQQVRIGETGLEHDRRWMVVGPDGHFVTQRELPRMALIQPSLHESGIILNAPTMPPLHVSGLDQSRSMQVAIWRDVCLAWDEGEDIAEWFSRFLQQPLRLVRFNDERMRLSNRDWTGALRAPNHFSDGFPIMIISASSLADLNSRLAVPLPTSRFRPNIVIDGIDPYFEDEVDELRNGEVCLRLVKPCTRCKITTTNQNTGVVEGNEPLLTLATYRRDLRLKGVTFGQNAVIVIGEGATLRVGERMALTMQPEPDDPVHL
jgi:uncharacterized protein YcbX